MDAHPTSDYSPDSLARKVGISRRLLDRMLKNGRGPAHLRIGRRVVIRREAAEEWLTTLESNSPCSTAERVQTQLAIPEPLLEILEATDFNVKVITR